MKSLTHVKCIVFCLLAGALLFTLLLAGCGSGTTPVNHITRSPSEWQGKSVTVQGWVDITDTNFFFLVGDDGGRITVQSQNSMPTGGMVNRVKVTGIVRVGKVYGEYGGDETYIAASSWKYID